MRMILSGKCERCGVEQSSQGLSLDEAKIVAALHVCADGAPSPIIDVVERSVPGPGERTKLPEERQS
jgi:hypothetical protein